jgi:hypothetical protein
MTLCMNSLVGALPAARAPRAAPKRAALSVPSFEGGLRRSAGLGASTGARPPTRAGGRAACASRSARNAPHRRIAAREPGGACRA